MTQTEKADDYEIECGHSSCAVTAALDLLRSYLIDDRELTLDAANYWLYSHADLIYEAQ